MKVKELIELLQEYDSNAEIYSRIETEDYWQTTILEKIRDVNIVQAVESLQYNKLKELDEKHFEKYSDDEIKEILTISY